VTVQHLHRDQAHALGHAVLRPADGAGDVGAVPVAVGVVGVHRVVAPGGPAAEGGVGDPDAGVDDVGVHVARRGVVRVAVVQRQVALVDAVQPPGRRVGLGGEQVHLGVGLDVGHPRVGGQPAGLGLAHVRPVTMQGGGPHAVYRAAVL